MIRGAERALVAASGHSKGSAEKVAAWGTPHEIADGIKTAPIRASRVARLIAIASASVLGLCLADASQAAPEDDTSSARLMIQSGHSDGAIGAVSLSPDGRLVATNVQDEFKIWSVENGRLICDMHLSRTTASRDWLGRRKEYAAQSENAQSFNSMAWSADSRFLYFPSSNDTLRKLSIAKCEPAEKLQLSLPAARQARDPNATLPGRPNVLDNDPAETPQSNDIEEISSLADGRILVLTTSFLYAVTLDTGRSKADVLMDLRVKPENSGPTDIRDLLKPGGLRKAIDKALRQGGSLALGGNSADGRVVGLVGKALRLGSVAAKGTSIEPSIVSSGKELSLSQLAGAEKSYESASLMAVSKSGRWVALRSKSNSGAQLSLFDLSLGKLVTREEIVAPAPPAESRTSLLSDLVSSGLQDRAFVGLSFSADEQYLALLRPRTKSNEQAASDPNIEIRRTRDLALIRTIEVTGYLGAPSGALNRQFEFAAANFFTTSAAQSTFVMQSAGISSGSVIATARWNGDNIGLQSWRAQPLSVTHLHFFGDNLLASTQTLPGTTLPEDSIAAPDLPPSFKNKALANLMGGVSVRRQTGIWSFESASHSHIHSGNVVLGDGEATLTDPLANQHIVSTLKKTRTGELRAELNRVSGDAAIPNWNRIVSDEDGVPRRAIKLAWSDNRELIAGVFVRLLKKESPAPPRASPPPAAAKVPPVPSAAPAAGPESSPAPDKSKADKLRSLIADVRNQIKRRGKEAQDTPAPSTEYKPSSTPEPAEYKLHVIDARSGETLAQIDAPDDFSAEGALSFLSAEKLLVGDAVANLRRTGARLQIEFAKEKAFSGSLIGANEKTGRLILATGRLQPGTAGFVLPSGLSRATRGSISDDDRWIAVESSNGVYVLDTQKMSSPVFSLAFGDRGVTAVALSATGKYLAVGTAAGQTLLYDVPSKRAVSTLFADSSGQWVVTDATGRFDTNDLGTSPPLHWVTSADPLNAIPFDALMRPYYTPGLLSRITTEGATMDSVRAIATRLRATPEVQIDQIVASQGKAGRVDVKVTVGEQVDSQGRRSGAHDLRLFRNGRLVGYAPKGDGALSLEPSTGKYMQWFREVALPAGEQPVQFTAHAFNSDGVRGNVAAANYRSPSLIQLPAARAFVVSVGVNKQRDTTFPTLSYAVNDARLMARRLGEGLRKSGLYAEVVEIVVASDRDGSDDAKKKNIQAAIQRLAGRNAVDGGIVGIANTGRLAPATPADLVIFTFAGHGYVSNLRQELHLVPSDAASNEGIQGLARFDSAAISAAELDHWFRDVDAGSLAIVIDACHSAAAVANNFRAGPMGSSGLGQLAYDKGARILAATQADDVALEHQKLEHGLLSYALVKEGLVEGAADRSPRDGAVDLVEWLRYPLGRIPQLVDELARGKFTGTVDGSSVQPVRAPARGVQVARRGLQQPKLFDYVPAGNFKTWAGRSRPLNQLCSPSHRQSMRKGVVPCRSQIESRR